MVCQYSYIYVCIVYTYLYTCVYIYIYYHAFASNEIESCGDESMRVWSDVLDGCWPTAARVSNTYSVSWKSNAQPIGNTNVQDLFLFIFLYIYIDIARHVRVFIFQSIKSVNAKLYSHILHIHTDIKISVLIYLNMYLYYINENKTVNYCRIFIYLFFYLFNQNKYIYSI